ncbi:hypothetical protein VTJ83DRAFT_3244 [Remersonia thermophila]|uniref:Uncharacterized protein n=1 Tax=Remersonia thermophila TaxID=72144 RepID=A0ABR4DDH4_9PEZI
MKLTVATLFALVAAAVAYPSPQVERRQNIVTLDASTPAMSDGGMPEPFDSIKVAELQRRGRLV